MFSNTVQPGIVSLFSSTGSQPLQLFSQHVDPLLKSDSLIHLLDDATSQPHPPAPGTLISLDPSSNIPRGGEDREDAERDGSGVLSQTVLHMQSPTIRTTYIRCPPLPPTAFSAQSQSRSKPSAAASTSSSASTPAPELGLTHGWVHLQVRSLGREWAFEVGVADRAGKRGVIRCSTFQKEAALKTQHVSPLLHIPLRFPPPAARPLTPWSTVSLDLAATLQQFRAVAAAQQQRARAGGAEDDEDGDDTNDDADFGRDRRRMRTPAPLPGGRFGTVLYVKVYANCRLRRIWLSEGRRGALPWEFELYASSASA